MVGVSSTTYTLEVSGGVRLTTGESGNNRAICALTAISGNGAVGDEGEGESGGNGGSGGHITIAAGSAGEGGNGDSEEEEPRDGGDAGEAGNVIIRAGAGAGGGEGDEGGSSGSGSPGGSVILMAGGEGDDGDGPGSIILRGSEEADEVSVAVGKDAAATPATEAAYRLDVNGKMYAEKVYVGAEPTAQHYYNLDVRGNDIYVALLKNTGLTASSHGLKIWAGTATAGQGTRYVACFDGDGDPYRGGLAEKSGEFGLEVYSDERGKEDITSSTTNGLDIVKRLRVSNFRYLGYTQPCTGFIAQELEAVYPEAVGFFEDTMIMSDLTTRTIPAGSLYRGKRVRETFVAEEWTTRSVTQSSKTIRPLSLIPVLWRAVQQQQAEIAALEAAVPADAARIAELEAALQEKVSVLDAAALQEALKDWTQDEKTMERIVDGVLAELGVDPWVEIPFSEAWEEAAETVPVEAVQLVTKYRINWETMTTEPYAVEETIVEQQPTGNMVKRLKTDVRFDERANKFYRRLPLSDPALKTALVSPGNLPAAAILKALGQALAREGFVVPVSTSQEKPSKERASLQEEGKVMLAVR